MFRLVATVALLVTAGSASARGSDVQFKCEDYVQLKDGNWKAKPGASLLLRGSKIDFSGAVFRPGGTRIDGVEVKSALDKQCKNSPAR